LADHFTAQGASVGIVGFSTVEDICGDGKKSTFRLEINSPDQPLDVARIAPLCASIAVYRLVFVPAEVMRAHGRIGTGIGRAVETPRVYTDDLDFYIPLSITTEHEAKRWIETAISKAKAA
jgi:hypothetical protein